MSQQWQKKSKHGCERCRVLKTLALQMFYVFMYPQGYKLCILVSNKVLSVYKKTPQGNFSCLLTCKIRCFYRDLVVHVYCSHCLCHLLKFFEGGFFSEIQCVMSVFILVVYSAPCHCFHFLFADEKS